MAALRQEAINSDFMDVIIMGSLFLQIFNESYVLLARRLINGIVDHHNMCTTSICIRIQRKGWL
jgi:hypothetical protein